METGQVAPHPSHEHTDSDGTPALPTGRALVAQALPFLFALALGLLLLPLQEASIDASQLAVAVAAIIAVVVGGIAVLSRPSTPTWIVTAFPYLYLVAVALLREATGGSRSGYVALLFLAPFWVALTQARRQVVLVTLAMFLVQVAQSFLDVDTRTGIAIRSALLTTVVIGIMSLAVQRSVDAQRRATRQAERDAAERARTNAELAESNLALERSNRDLEQFAYVSSHDLQEPLRMIRSFSQLFMQRYGANIEPEGRELLDFVVDGADRAQALVADLLDYSRVGSSAQPFARVELDDVVEQAIDVLAPSIEDSQARVFRSDGMPAVHGDRAQLERLVVNLVGNAIKYRHPDRAPEIRIASTVDGNRVRMEVSDNGIGFDAEHQDRIFLMFQRLHARGDYDGTGIGLAICSRIVERHGGSITATSTPGEGSTFAVTLDVAS